MNTQDYNALLDSYGNHFSIGELEIQGPGTVKRMDIGFLRSFLAWRRWHGLSTLISSAWRKGDQKSHGHGMAFDVLLFDQWLESQPSALQHWLLATTWGFNGVGLYFDWSYTNKEGNNIPAIGLHVDGWAGNSHSQRPLRWLRIDGHYYYQSLASGIFHCKSNKQSITLDEAIRRYGP
ncbi:hypothetical protein CK503_08540 [Aliifodinibius salipaludis]|jgi:hypothetical protein|uniref:Uncharacterized protein n=1 Tax=Fodinibius salipaludis TaxID=2032627 RepID=A0A2A2G9J1_9BACT|nr:hypothetical protein [Aliifodinibius salipaludis]PAU94251.1 hypothetical protein CK503_08540 [Aliifodinibius salipaludis]